MSKGKLIRGRPPRLTPKLGDDICKVIAAGNYLETAAALCGVPRQTVMNWMTRGARLADDLEKHRVKQSDLRAHDAHQLDFWAKVQEALAKAEVRDVLTIEKAATDGDWRAAAHLLERRSPERWGRREDVKVTATMTVNTWADLAKLGEEVVAKTMTMAALPAGAPPAGDDDDDL